jgi:hypothetical protein
MQRCDLDGGCQEWQLEVARKCGTPIEITNKRMSAPFGPICLFGAIHRELFLLKFVHQW